MPQLKRAAITRAGHEYQDLIGIQYLIDFYRNRSKYRWMQLESDDPVMGYLDDIVVAYADGSFDLIQVKFTVDPTVYFLDWDWLLAKKPRGTSLLKKWSSTVSGFSGGQINIACLQTNRTPDTDFLSALDSDGRVDLDRLDPTRRAVIEAEIGNVFLTQRFFRKFHFLHSKPMLNDLEMQLRSSIVPTDTDINGWMTLLWQAKHWAMTKNAPQPDGKITHKHLTQIITRKAPRPIPQSFVVPAGYTVPNQGFHDNFLKHVSRNQAISALWGTPGRGKSTYLSFLTDALRNNGVPVVRHHYFLSLDDTTADRFSFTVIAQSLINQIVVHYPAAVKGQILKEEPDQLPNWLSACGKYYATIGKPFIVVIDGLDHVWRERMNLDQLNHLFENLIPCAPNVSIIVGTQKIPNDKLPPRLLRKITKKDWWEIPAMNELSVQSWVKQQHVAKRLRLPSKRRFDQSATQQVAAIGKAFFDISKGHPLHLIYSFEALVRTGQFVDEETVRLLPVCPGEDINNYYALLWANLSKGAKEIMHVIAGSDFHWPLSGIVRYFSQIDEVDFLLEHRRIGLVPFHGSILAFVREMPGHSAVFQSLLPRIVKWLKKDAPPYWRWGWLWLMQSKLGDHGPLLRGANRAWAVDSIKAGWPLDRMMAILKAAELITFESDDYAKTIELRSLKTRLSNANEYQTSDYGQITECALIASKNVEMIDVLADGLTGLGDKDILTLSRAAKKLRPEVCEEAREELRQRVNLWLNLRHRAGREFVALTKAFLEAISLCEIVEVDKAVRFIGGFTDGEVIFEDYLEYLVRAAKVDALTETYSALKSSKKKEWKRKALDALIRCAAAESVDLAPIIDTLSIDELSAFAACWLQYHKLPVRAPVKAAERPKQLTDADPEYRRNYAVEHYLYDLFFYELYESVTNSAASPQAHPKSSEFIDQAINMIEECARNVGSGNSQLSFAAIYYAANSIAPIDDRKFNDPVHNQYFGLKHALRRISIDTHLIKQPSGRFYPLSASELTTGKLSKHWVEELWIEEQLRRNLPILAKAQAKESLVNEIAYLDEHVTQFNERADKWSLLGRLGILYELPEAEVVIRRAADCALGYGWRKDLGLNDVLDAVAEVHVQGAASGMRMLRQLVPIVDQITKFTDGDETDHVRSELIEVVARVAPSTLPQFYEHHLEQDEFRYAEEVLEQHLRTANLDGAAAQALGHTLMEDRDISVLADLASKSSKAANLLRDQEMFLGGKPPKKREYGSTGPDHARSGTPPKVEKYGPSEFSKLVRRVRGYKLGYEHQRQALEDWLYYWEKRGKARVALRSIKEFFEKEENVYFAETVLDDAFVVSKRIEGKGAAFYWLVKAQIHRNGWRSYWTSEAEVMTRLKQAAQLYKSDWRRFIFESSAPAKYWKRRNHSFSIGVRYLVRFLLMVGQNDKAVEFTRALIRTANEEVSDQPISASPWFN